MPDKDTRHIQEVRQAFFDYVEMELPVIPVCPYDHRKMSHTHRQKCKTPGKVPAISGWEAHNETTFTDVEKWLNTNEYYNIGLPLGQNSLLVGIDIDGQYGEEKLREMSNGDLPATWEFKTHSGRRLLYRLPLGVPTKKMKQTGKKGAHEELALLCDGQQTVLPPSRHPSGSIYTWREEHSPRDLDPADAPKWLLDAVTAPREAKPEKTVAPSDWTTIVQEGHRNNQLTKLAGSLVARQNIPKEQIILFLDTWNQAYCQPPLDRIEIEKMVETIAVSEAMKRAQKQSKKDRPVLRATPMAMKFIQWQKDQGYRWKFATDQGAFYFCDEAVGPWMRLDQVSVNKAVRSLLTNIQLGGSADWDGMHYVNETVNAMKELIADTDDGVFDLGKHASEYQHIISLENGLLHWKDLELKNWDPAVLTTIQLPVKWDEHATAPTWERALEEWIPDKATRLFLQEYVGLCLIPDTSFRTAVFLYGVGANGKSLFLEGIRMLFGSALVTIPLHRLADRFETANLQNRLINVCGDIDAKYLTDTGVLKALIGGDSLRGEFKHGKSFDFIPVSRLMFSANQLPRVSDKSAAWYSRWKFVEFPNRFPINSAYKIELMSKLQQEKAGMLRWAVEGLRRVKKTNMFTQSDTMMQSEQTYRAENDNVLAFMMDALTVVTHTGGETTYSTASLYMTYKDWCESNGFSHVGQIEFVKRLQMNGIEKARRPIKGKTCACFIAVKLASEYEEVYNFWESARRQPER